MAEPAAPRWVGARQGQLGHRPRRLVGPRPRFPEADVPVLQLSINASDPSSCIAPSRAGWRRCAAGVLIVASGNVVHNLGLMDLGASRRRLRLGAALRRGGSRHRRAAPPATCCGWPSIPTTRWPVPTPDHFIPLLYFAGVAAGGGDDVRPPEVLVDGYANGSLSMTCYTA